MGKRFWSRWYFISIVGKDDDLIRNYIREHEKMYERLDQMSLWM